MSPRESASVCPVAHNFPTCETDVPPVVPWVVAWSEELKEEIRPCKHAGGRLAVWQPYKPNVGKPHFKVLHRVRHRNAVKNLLCIVCGEPTNEEDRWVVSFGDWTVHRGQPMFSLEPPMHERCVDYSLAHCPKLRSEGHVKAKVSGGHYHKVNLPEMLRGRVAAGRTHLFADRDTALRLFGKRVAASLRDFLRRRTGAA